MANYVGREIIVDQDGEGYDFNLIYPELDVNDAFIVTRQTEREGRPIISVSYTHLRAHET